MNRLQAGLLQTNVLLNTGFVPEVIPGLDKAELYIDGEPLRVLVCGELISVLFCSVLGAVFCVLGVFELLGAVLTSRSTYSLHFYLLFSLLDMDLITDSQTAEEYEDYRVFIS